MIRKSIVTTGLLLLSWPVTATVAFWAAVFIAFNH